MNSKKFKIWNNKEKRWEENWCSIFIADNGEVFDDDFMSSADTPYLEIRKTKKDLTIVWPTGLTDKNGKECYEYDFVKYENFYHHSGIALVVFKDGCFYVEDKNIEVSLFAILNKFNGEIVGNRFENPELLEQS